MDESRFWLLSGVINSGRYEKLRSVFLPEAVFRDNINSTDTCTLAMENSSGSINISGVLGSLMVSSDQNLYKKWIGKNADPLW